MTDVEDVMWEKINDLEFMVKISTFLIRQVYCIMKHFFFFDETVGII